MQVEQRNGDVVVHIKHSPSTALETDVDACVVVRISEDLDLGGPPVLEVVVDFRTY